MRQRLTRCTGPRGMGASKWETNIRMGMQPYVSRRRGRIKARAMHREKPLGRKSLLR